MKKMFTNASTPRVFLTSILFFFSIMVVSSQGEESASTSLGDPVKGKTLFNLNCASCHKLDDASVGPPLRGVVEKYEGDIDWLQAWITNNEKLRASGDKRAIEVYEKYNKVTMNAFEQLSKEDIGNILAYASQVKVVSKPSKVVSGAESVQQTGVSQTLVLVVLVLLLVVLVVMLVVVNGVLKKLALANGVKESDLKGKPFWRSFLENEFMMVVTSILFLLVAAYFGYGYLMQVGVDQGYQPVQPIHFSHKIHAGDNGIDCKYCHSSARVSKTSGIPSLNVCMNCHKNISQFEGDNDSIYELDKAAYTKEIAKLYDAVGWDPSKQAYTGETKPVKWVRVHNLPDFVYFNHSQHVTVAGIDCQKCHGPVEEMEVLYQHEPLTMGWCVNCHRETNVDLKGNDYYEKIHQELSKKYGKEKLTIADMGGLECGKCHY